MKKNRCKNVIIFTQWRFWVTICVISENVKQTLSSMEAICSIAQNSPSGNLILAPDIEHCGSELTVILHWLQLVDEKTSIWSLNDVMPKQLYDDVL